MFLCLAVCVLRADSQRNGMMDTRMPSREAEVEAKLGYRLSSRCSSHTQKREKIVPFAFS